MFQDDENLCFTESERGDDSNNKKGGGEDGTIKEINSSVTNAN